MNILPIDIFDIPQLIPEVIELQFPEGIYLKPVFCYISHYNSGSRHARMKQPINRLFLSSRRTF